MPRVSGLGAGEVKNANIAAGVVENDRLKFFESSELALPVSAVLTAAHGFGQKPKRFQIVMRCVVAEYGYSVGDEIDITSGAPSTNGAITSSNFCDATNIGMSVGAINYLNFDKNTTTGRGATAANWRIVMRGWK